MKSPSIVIVGGGPAGAATACGLAQQGFSVQLFESYPRTPSKTSSKAYVIALHRRGQNGILSATGRTVQSGIMSKKGFQHPSMKKFERDYPAVLVPRQDLALELVEAAEKAGAKVLFDHKLVDCNIKENYIVVEHNQKQQKIEYDLLVGCDGSKSSVRRFLEEQANLTVRTVQDTMEYQVAILKTNPFEEAVHAWNDENSNSMCLGFPLVNGGLLLAPVFPEGMYLQFKEAYQKTGTGYEPLQDLLSDIPKDAMKDVIAQLSLGHPANGGLCVWCSSLGSDAVALVGDAGHGMWPSLGQGANCALESAGIFCKVVQNVSLGEDWGRRVVQEYDRRRYADAQAAVDLTFGGIGSRTSRARGNAPFAYKAQMLGMMLLNKLSLGVIPAPALLRIMRGDTAPYSLLRSYHFYYERMICLGAIILVVAPVALRALRKLLSP